MQPPDLQRENVTVPGLSRAPAVDALTCCYDLVARLYLQGPEALRRHALPPLNPLLEGLAAIEPAWAEELGSLLASCDATAGRAELREEHARIVTVPSAGRYIPPYGSVYLDGGTLWGPSTLDVLRWYGAAGLEWQPGRQGPAGGIVSAPDHLGLEFAFLALTRAAGATWKGGAGRGAQFATGFLDAHVGRWLPAYRSALDSSGGAPLLGRFIGLAVELVVQDRATRAVSPMT